MATVIKTDGSEEALVGEKAGQVLSLDQMQTAVGGCVEKVVIGSRLMLVDEDGKIKGKTINETASYMVGQVVVGDVVVAEPWELG